MDHLEFIKFSKLTKKGVPEGTPFIMARRVIGQKVLLF